MAGQQLRRSIILGLVSKVLLHAMQVVCAKNGKTYVNFTLYYYWLFSNTKQLVNTAGDKPTGNAQRPRLFLDVLEAERDQKNRAGLHAMDDDEAIELSDDMGGESGSDKKPGIAVVKSYKVNNPVKPKNSRSAPSTSFSQISDVSDVMGKYFDPEREKNQENWQLKFMQVQSLQAEVQDLREHNNNLQIKLFEANQHARDTEHKLEIYKIKYSRSRHHHRPRTPSPPSSEMYTSDPSPDKRTTSHKHQKKRESNEGLPN